MKEAKVEVDTITCPCGAVYHSSVTVSYKVQYDIQRILENIDGKINASVVVKLMELLRIKWIGEERKVFK